MPPSTQSSAPPLASTAAASEKDTRHVVFDIAASGLTYEPGDSFGLYPKNDPALAEAVRAALACPQDFPIGGKPIRDALIEDYSLGLAPDALFELISFLVGGERRRRPRRWPRARTRTATRPRSTCWPRSRSSRLCIPTPRLSSSAWSRCSRASIPSPPRPLATPAEIHLTVDAVRYEIAGRQRLGVRLDLSRRPLEPGAPRQSLHAEGAWLRAASRTVPHRSSWSAPAPASHPSAPSCGIARPREREGRAWLFFGHQHEAHDFFYRDEFEAFLADGTLTRLSTAWSRDGAQKVYVQDRMREAGPELWAWLKDGAHFYVCGDAKRMAKDVETALVEISAKAGQMSEAAARDFIAELKATGRYQADVY